jgi:hypothetical protein
VSAFGKGDRLFRVELEQMGQSRIPAEAV